MRFLKKVCRHEGGGHLQIMYGIDGRRDLVERQLDHLAGYQGSRPVRVGNGAVGQLQLDVYGEVLETADIWRRNQRDDRRHLAGAARPGGLGQQELAAARLQHLGGSGRGAPLRVQQGDELGGARPRRPDGGGARAGVERGRVGGSQRDALHAEIMERGWSERHQSFTQAYDDDALDAAALAIPMVRFLPWNHPRVHGTVRAIARELTSADGELVYRYRQSDGLEGEEGAFSICTFWLAQALAMIGERERAERVFRRMLRHANHVGLYSEEIDPLTGQFLGNFPQAFTHIALINCAAALARHRSRRGSRPQRRRALGRLPRRFPDRLLGGLPGAPSWHSFWRPSSRASSRLFFALFLAGSLRSLLGAFLAAFRAVFLATAWPPSWRSFFAVFLAAGCRGAAARPECWAGRRPDRCGGLGGTGAGAGAGGYSIGSGSIQPDPDQPISI